MKNQNDNKFMVTIEGKTYDETQLWWQNFMEYFDDKYYHQEFKSDSHRDATINKELGKFKGKMILSESALNGETDVDSIAFESEKYYTAFLLKWS